MENNTLNQKVFPTKTDSSVSTPLHAVFGCCRSASDASSMDGYKPPSVCHLGVKVKSRETRLILCIKEEKNQDGWSGCPHRATCRALRLSDLRQDIWLTTILFYFTLISHNPDVGIRNKTSSVHWYSQLSPYCWLKSDRMKFIFWT